MNKKILIVDDDSGILEALKLLLEDDGYEVFTETNPRRVVEKGNSIMPGLIFLDILLSGGDGREICKVLKTDKKTKDIPVVLMSAAPDLNKTIKDTKADGFLPKPFEMDELHNLTDRFLDS